VISEQRGFLTGVKLAHRRLLAGIALGALAAAPGFAQDADQ
jgi:hypothetical protein